jgi:hypothetical protein
MSNIGKTPWSVGYICLGAEKHIDSILDANGRKLCEGMFWSETGTHDAPLMAEAPALLECLERAVSTQGFSNEDLITARKVIAKARGEK